MCKCIRKCSYIRDNDSNMCPFGLSIPRACGNVGVAIERMAPINNDNRIVSVNKVIFAYNKTGKPCKYAAEIMDKFKKVNCNFGDNGEGLDMPAPSGSPFYPSIFAPSFEGLYGFPLNFYSNNDDSRNLFFGLFSVFGDKEFENILKKYGK